MELLEGDVLAKLIGRGQVGTARVIDVGTQIADALDAAHAERIVHRDLKPANVFVTRGGHVKLLDFGVALLLPRKPHAYSGGRLTTSTAGTIPYMSPEQAQAEELDHRSDLFSLGVVLYEMATGHRPFVAATGPDTLTAITTCTPVAPRAINARIPDELERIIVKALEKKAALRYQTASDLKADLQRLKRDLEANPAHALPPQPPRTLRAPGLRWWAGGAVAVLALGGAGWLFVTANAIVIALPVALAPPPQIPPARFRLRHRRRWSLSGGRRPQRVAAPTGANGCRCLRPRPSTSSPLPDGSLTCACQIGDRDVAEIGVFGQRAERCRGVVPDRVHPRGTQRRRGRHQLI